MSPTMSLASMAGWRGVLAALVLLGAAHPAASQTTSTKGSITRVETQKPAAVAKPREFASCAADYLASLKRIESGTFARLKAAASGTAAGDPRLPGMLLVTPRAAPRSKLEVAALAAANAAARSKGRAAGNVDADSTWLAGRLRTDLGDYLGQGPSPYLCGGVPAYVDTLRRFADRIGSSPDRRAALRVTQAEAARRSIDAALASMRPVAAPRFAPSDRPDLMAAEMTTGGIAGLRPAAGVSRGNEASGASGSGIGRDIRPETSADPDLPPLARPEPIALSTVAELAAAVDLLIETANLNGFVTANANQMAIGGHAGLSPLGFPVLSRIAKAREYVAGERPLVSDRSARMALAAALSDIEALDYLIRAESQEADPVGLAIHATLDEILAAHKRDCTCRP